jgi:hypothetical protein
MPDFTNETTLERISCYVQEGLLEQAEALAILCDQLEENFAWEMTFVPYTSDF